MGEGWRSCDDSVIYMKKTIKSLVRRGAVALLLVTVFFCAADGLVDKEYSKFRGDEITVGDFITINEDSTSVMASGSVYETYSGTAMLFDTVPLGKVSISVFDEISLCPGGMPFGVKFFTDGLMVVGLSDVDTEGGAVGPARDAGVAERDVIIKINGEVARSVEDLIGAVENSGGAPLTLTLRRDTSEFEVTINPAFSVADGKYKTGMWIRDSAAGVGTVTFVSPETGAFAGLGHGICDSVTGELMPMLKGIVVDVSIEGIDKGIAGDPGELKGFFSSGKKGALIGNTMSGVFGVLSEVPESIKSIEALPVGLRDSVHEGEAYIMCTLDDNTIGRYAINISEIQADASDNKCFVVTVTDATLIEKTGGIVQGMSGSPVIQDGRLIGAVTHVLIGDPTKGYGIFIENMLREMPDILK